MERKGKESRAKKARSHAAQLAGSGYRIQGALVQGGRWTRSRAKDGGHLGQLFARALVSLPQPAGVAQKIRLISPLGGMYTS